MDPAICLENGDLMRNILSRLPAKSFASAACVSKTWSQACDQCLFKPKLASALSLSSSLHVAVKEVVDKVLSEPIRPHFAIACVSPYFNLAMTHRMLIEKMGYRTPIITHAATGIMGRNSKTNEMMEVNWEALRVDVRNPGGIIDLVSQSLNCGIVLLVGFVPGLKVNTIPLVRTKKDVTFLKTVEQPMMESIHKLIIDIKEYTGSVSGSTSPEAIIIFGDHCTDMTPVLVQMDNHFPIETTIVGDAGGAFMFKGIDERLNNVETADAVALVFAKDRHSPRGKIEFHVNISDGIIPFGPELRVVSASAKRTNSTWITAVIEEHPGLVHSWGLLDDITEEIEDNNPTYYMGVTHQKTGPRFLESSSSSYISYYKVLGDAERYYFIVEGVGIKPGDTFVFYHSDSETTEDANSNAYQELSVSRLGGREVIGGLIFSCCSRGERGNVDSRVSESLPFCTNYPGVAVAGMFCDGEIGRVVTRLYRRLEDGELGTGKSIGCYLHRHSTVYLVMSYTSTPSS